MSAPILTLQDNFDDNSFSSTLWTKTNTQVLETNCEIEMTTLLAGNYVSVDAVASYDLTGGAAAIQLVNSGNQSLASLEVFPIILIKDASNLVQWYLNSGTLKCLKKIATTQTQQGSSLTYDATIHKFFRIRESAGTVYWDYSTDGFNWTNQASIAVGSLFAVTTLSVEFTTGTFAVEASTTKAIFDDFNLTGIMHPINRGLRPRMFAPGIGR